MIAFLHPFFCNKFGFTTLGTLGSAVSPEGNQVYITWNGNRGSKAGDQRPRFNTCALTVVHIPESERQP